MKGVKRRMSHKYFDALVLDIDGTAVRSDKSVDPRTIAAIEYLHQLGVKVFLASGRPPKGVFPVAETLGLSAHGGYILAFNGARIVNLQTGETFRNRTIPPETVLELWREANHRQLGCMIYGDGEIISNGEPDVYMQSESDLSNTPLTLRRGDNLELPAKVFQTVLTGDPSTLEELATLLAPRYKGKADIFHSEPGYLECTSWGNDKAEGIKELFQMLDISLERAICVGDSYNDIPMIRQAGVGVAMQNAPKGVKAFADYVTDRSADDGGIAEVVEEFFA